MRFFDVAKKISSVVILSLFVFSIFENLTYAQTATPASKLDCTKEYCALTTIPGAFDACKVNKNGVVTCDEGPIKNPVSVIKNIYGISIGIGAMLAIVMIIWAGIEYATTEAVTGKSDAKEKWQGAAFGLLLLLASYIILRTINVDLVNINLDLGTPIKCTPTKDTDGKDIPCGASADALSNIVKKAQENISSLNTKISNLDREIKNTTDKTTITQLRLEKDTKTTQVAYIKAVASADHAVAYVESYLSSQDSGSYSNIDTYFKVARTDFDSARAKLEVLYKKNKDPEIAKQIVDIDTKKLVFNAESSQLQTVKNYQNAEGITGSLLNSKTNAVTTIKRIGDTAISHLRGDESSITKIKAATARRVKIICPTCK